MKVLVTGGSRGIGKAVAELYRQNGYEVDAPARADLDLSDRESVSGFVETHKDRGYGIIINNAGCNFVNPLEDIKEEEIFGMINVNLLAPVFLLKGFIPAMKEKGFGRIVNIGSIWGVTAKPGRSIYGATKHGIHGITMGLAAELGSCGILVNTVAPGQTRTLLTLRNNSAEDIKKMEQDIPVGRLAQPEEIANAVFFLGSEKNTYITGQQLVVDGGLTIV